MSHLKIIFENQFWIFVDKPVNTLSVPSRMGLADSRRCIGTELQNQLGHQIWPVHRLDFEVSGLLMFAKSALAHRSACFWFEKNHVQKKYQALSHGRLTDCTMSFPLSWTGSLVRGKKRSFQSPHGQETLTLVHRIEPLEGISSESPILSFELEPVTGKPHQLRHDMSRMGWPILGDELYGGQKWQYDGIALRNIELGFINAPEFQKWELPSKIVISELKF